MPEGREFRRVPAYASSAWLILLVGAVLSALGWQAMEAEVERDARARFNELVVGTSSDMQGRLRGYTQILYGVQGLFHATPDVSRETFYRYLQNLNLAQRAGALRSISYAPRIAQPDRSAFEQRVRGDTSMSPAGHPGFAIRPPGERAEYVPLLYLEPFGYNAAGLGLDLIGEPGRRAAVERARDAGTPTLSTPFKLVSAPETQDVAVSLRLAVYRGGRRFDTVQGRRDAFAGIVSATFLVRDVVGAVLSEEVALATRVRVFDTGVAHGADSGTGLLLYETNALPDARVPLVDAVTIEVGDHRWLLQIAARRDYFVTAERYLPWLVLVAGLLVSLLLAGLVRALLSARHRALALAERMTEDLRRSEAKLAESHRRTQELIEALPNPIFFKDTEGRYLGVNKAWEAYFGIARRDFIGKTVHDLYPDSPAVAERLHAMDQELWDRPGSQVYETRITTRDGAHHDAIYCKATYSRADGGVAGLIGTIIDITDRKRVERLQAMEHAVTRVLAEAGSVREALPEIIRTICATMDWACGARWELDKEARVLRCAEHWGVDALEVQRFLAWSASREVPLAKSGEGLVRRSQASGEPVWIADLAAHGGLVRGEEALRAGLEGGMAMPLLAGGEVFSVLEFLFRGVRQPDAALLAMSRSIGSQIGQFMARMQVEEAVRFVATHDGLTRLPNRVMFHQRLEHAITQARRHGRQLAVLFVDLDRFKLINDTLGHEAGDELLREVSRRLREGVRAGDTVARLGGDEFVVLLEEIGDPLYVGSVARKLIIALGESFVLAGREYSVSASIGVSTFPADADDAAGLLKNADIAMYRAKERGRNTFQFYSAEMNVHSVERLNLESSLRRALERGELLLHYQPQVGVASGRIHGVEALVRWRHPELGIVPPARFISVAEETGLIVPIGEWVLHTACRARRDWAARGLPPGRMAVNLSPRQFLHGDLVRDIRRVLDETRCDPAAIELEITESMVMHDPKRATKLLRRLKDMGVLVAIDDFGTGYSSLAYLKRFPIDCLKIDRSFIKDIPGDAGNVAITQAVIVMARSLSLLVIAEGVETAEQFEFLRTQSCDEYQGYFFSPPVEEAALLGLLERAASPPPRTAAAAPR